MKKNYPSDMTSMQWISIEKLFPKQHMGRPNMHRLRDVLNAIFYILRTGCQWRYLPKEFPPWQTVYHHFRRLKWDGTFEKINAALRENDRRINGRKETPTGAIIDSQSVKTTEKGALEVMTEEKK